MKIAILLGSWSVSSRPLDFWYDNINISLRALSGTDLAFCRISSELAKLGHDIHMFTCHAEPDNKPDIWEGCKLYNIDERVKIINDSFDAVISINEPDGLRSISKKPLHICWQFLNDFSYCAPGFDNAVDIWLAPGEMLMERLKSMCPKPEKWKVLRLGCDPEVYEDKRVPGRVVWTSSVDRGLHWLLGQWPKIKDAIPEATLKIFYHFTYGSILSIEPNATDQHPHVVEMGQRLRYIKNCVGRLKHLGVSHVGSTSRKDMVKEMSEASVFISPCDTVAFSEGFSISTLEALASYTIPIVTDVDCLGSIYENSGAIMVNSPIQEHLQEFTNSIIKALKK